MFDRTLTALLIPLCLLTGCSGGDGPALADVEGIVTLNGRPVPNAQVLFVPTGVKQSNPSYGLTDAQGHYTLLFTRDKSGAMIASHNVKITTQKYSPEDLSNMKAAGQDVSNEFVALPKKYREDGTLTAEVVKGRNRLDFPLTSE